VYLYGNILVATAHIDVRSIARIVYMQNTVK